MVAGVDECVAGVLREGMTEIELAAEVEAWLRRQGHQGVIRMRAFNGEVHYGTIAAGPGRRGAGRDGHSSRRGRPEPLRRQGALVPADRAGRARDRRLSRLLARLHGRSDAHVLPRAAGAHICARRTTRRSRSCAGWRRPPAPASPARACGSSPSSSPARGADHYASAGRISFVAHGFGLEIDEPPFLARGYEAPLAEGMVFALEPKFVYEGEGAVGIENSYAVTADGVERLTTAPEELIEL